MLQPSLATSLWKTIAEATSSQTYGRSHFRTIAILPFSPQVPSTAFVRQLSAAFERTRLLHPDDMVSLDSSTMTSSVGRSIYTKSGKVWLEQYLAQIQENVELTILVADDLADSTWTNICISNVSMLNFLDFFLALTGARPERLTMQQADCVMFVAMIDDPPARSPMERRFFEMGGLSQKKLILLHDAGAELAGATDPWFSVSSIETPVVNISFSLILIWARIGNGSETSSKA
jgi:hypothetical protein